MHHVFISYVHENKQIVDRLYSDLSKYGIKVWLDRNDLEPGTFWKDAIRRAISDGAFFVACFSDEYRGRDSTYMNEEIKIAIDELRKRSADKTWFIPILLSGEVPDISIGAGETLNSIQRLNLTEKNWTQSIDRLLKVILKNENAQITNIICTPKCIKRGETISLSFDIAYGGTSPLERIMLGASIISDETGEEYFNKAQDTFVTLKPGTDVYSRELTLPSSYPVGQYCVVGAIWKEDMYFPLDRRNLGSVLKVEG